MDRLDSWLNGQAGWRRAALIWLVFCPVAVAGGSLIRVFISLQRPGCEQLAGVRFTQECEPRLGTGFLAVAALSVLAIAPIAGLLALWLRRWAARHPGKPFFSWCRVAYLWCVMAFIVLSNLFNQQPHSRSTHDALGLAELALIVAAAVFVVVEMRRRRRSRRNPPLV